jgi:GDPmannose 4,6-dehydratase
MAKTAIITGIRGQDGAYLAEHLLAKGYRVLGADRRSGGSSHWRLRELGILDDIEFVPMDLLEMSNIVQVLHDFQPDEFYNLAAQSFVKTSFLQPILTTQINALGVLRILEAIRTVSPHTKFYQASSSEMFGKVQETPQTERTPFYPRSPYGISKLYAHWATVNYREAYNLYATSGILFNHESPLRGEEFVTRKITMGVASYLGMRECRVVPVIWLGNINAMRDWSHARDMVRGMHLMLQQPEASSYVLASGEYHSVKEFADIAFGVAGITLEWSGSGHDTIATDRENGKVCIAIDPEFYREAEVDTLLGDASKAREVLGWAPAISFQELVREMVELDIRRTQ